MKNTVILTLMLLVSSMMYSQEKCDCSANFKWMIETFEKNDAGFKYIVDIKGKDYYTYFTKKTLKDAENIDNIFECRRLMNKWLSFFRKGHIGVTLNTYKKRKFEYLFDSINIDHQQFRKSLLKNNISKFEGVWDITPYFTIGIIPDKSLKVKEKEYVRKYIGFIITSNVTSWKPNQIKLEIFESQTTGKYMMKYYTGDHSLQQFPDVEFVGDNYIKSGFIVMEKQFPKRTKTKIAHKIEVQFMENKFPFATEISDKTMYLRLPSFYPRYKKQTDSVLLANFKDFTSHQNLIIDIRNNPGGSDLGFKNVLPLLYTNPIREVQVAFLSTELNSKTCLNLINDTNTDKETKAFCEKLYRKMKNNPDKFVSSGDSLVELKKFDTIYKYPEKVAILINKQCASAAEQFIYEAKQSYKVKLFGTSTYGAIDISNVNAVVFPTDKRFTLYYSTSKSYRIPDLIADDIGFQPDYYFDKTIKPYDWIEKTLEILNDE